MSTASQDCKRCLHADRLKRRDMQFNYYSDNDVLMPPIRRQIANRWMRRVCDEMNRTVGEINFQYTDDEGILRANKAFLQHDYYTDVITFPRESEREGDDAIYGDILISIDTVATNAQELGVQFQQELYRVMIHGILHLLGIDDQTDSERELMRMAEDRALMQLVEMLEGRDYFLSQGGSKFFKYVDKVCADYQAAN